MNALRGIGAAASNASDQAPGQLVKSLIIVAILWLLLLTGDTLVNVIQTAGDRFQVLMDYTAVTANESLVIHQDSTRYSNAKQVGLSINERTGIEFAYSFYLFIYPSTFSGEQKLYHVFHKGYGCPWPLMGPGVFLRGDENTMRVFMNTYKAPYTFVDIKNIPVQKWFHVTLNCYKKGLDVFINGILANRLPFTDTEPYQNYQDIILFSNAKYNNLNNSNSGVIPPNEFFTIGGAFNGQMSRFKYARYALATSEINALMNEGPSPIIRDRTADRPPYMADDWWATQV